MELATVLEKVSSTASKKEKVDYLAGYLRSLAPNAAKLACRFATGRTLPRGSKNETSVGYSTIVDVLLELSGVSPKNLWSVYMKHGDLGDVAFDLLKSKRETLLFSEPITVSELGNVFERMSNSRGKGSTSLKKTYLKSLLLRSNTLEAKYIVKILTHEMRIGLVDGLVEESIAKAYSIARKDVSQAYLLLGDIGLLAAEAAVGELTHARVVPLKPTNFMLAEPMPTAESIMKYFDKRVYAEYKYDGIRAQIHRFDGQVRVFSRRLEDISDSFPEIVEEAVKIQHDFILDGEIVPFREGRPIAFQLLQRRLRRKEGLEIAAGNAPVVYFAFDILTLDGTEVFAMSLAQRTSYLTQLVGDRKIVMAERKVIETPAELEKLFRQSRDQGYEGLVVKDPDSPYTPGKRGKFWLKLKEELDTLDVVIVAAEYGHGRRAGVISDYTFAVRDNGDLKTIGKAYSGLTDEEINEMTTRLKKITIEDQGYRRTVRPEVVLEVAFDSIQRSDRHESGFALRFPRIKRIRDDKSAQEIDTMERVREVFEKQRVRLDET